MRVFKGKRLGRWGKDNDLDDKAIWQAAREVTEGIYEADLGQCLYKKRIARPGQGKRSGFRTIVAFKDDNNDKVFFMYGFAKNKQSNITNKEKDALGLTAKAYLKATNEVLNNLKTSGELIEVEEAENNE